MGLIFCLQMEVALAVQCKPRFLMQDFLKDKERADKQNPGDRCRDDDDSASAAAASIDCVASSLGHVNDSP